MAYCKAVFTHSLPLGDRTAFIQQISLFVLSSAILALSWDFLARTGQLSLAHAAFCGLGAHTFALLANAGVPQVIAFMAAGVFSSLASLLLGLVTFVCMGCTLRLPQIAQPFPEMTVLENVAVGALFAANLPMKVALARADEVLTLTGLMPKRDVAAHNLSLLEDKRLEMARALVTNPKVLLLDEVMAGLRPAEALEAVEVIKTIRAQGVAVLFIEHLMHVVRELADRVVVLDAGAVLAVGTYLEVTQNTSVIEAYLGTGTP
jgi:hypothetical protein